MNDKRKSIQGQLKDMRKQRTKARMDNTLLKKIQGIIEQLEIEEKRYDVRKNEPVKLSNGLVINAKLAKEYLKKLKGLPVEFKLGDSTLEISYRTKNAKGKLTLVDMREYFIGLNLPVKEADEDGQISFN
jgi:hypothetical protein